MQHNIVYSIIKISFAISIGLLSTSCISTTGASKLQIPDMIENNANDGYPVPTRGGNESLIIEAYPPPNLLNDEPYSPVTPQIGQEILPWPTFTPMPTPSRQPIATPTALLLREPDKNITGGIVYLEKDEGNLLLPFHLLLGESGELLTPSEPISRMNTGISVIEPVSLYPSPDGKYAILTDGWGVRYLLNSDTGEQRPLFQNMLDPKGQSFNWHPDSKHFLIEAEEGSIDTGLWLVNVETGKYSVLFHQFPTPYIVAGAVSPSGQHIVYVLDTNQAYEHALESERIYEVWLSDINGDNAQLIWESNTHIGLFSWSPNGRYLAMNGGRIMDMDNFTVNSVTNNMADGYGYAFRSAWSPNSRYIAFVAFDEANPLSDGFLPLEGYSIDIFKGTNIHVLDVETGEENVLIKDKGTGHIYPTWSPNGSQIVFVSDMSGESEVWIIDANGSSLQQLTDSQKQIFSPYWTAFEKAE